MFGLQYARAFASLGVVAFHAPNHPFDLTIGQAGVDIFFVLSGFIMIAITNDQTKPLIFLKDRILRIVPPYWIATTVMAVGGMLSLFPAMKLTWWHIVGSLLFIPHYSPSNGHLWPLLVPGWTLNYEMYFYLFFAISLWFFKGVRLILSLTAIFIASAVAGLLHSFSFSGLAFYTDPILIEFLAGMWLAQAWKARALPKGNIGYLLILASLIGFLFAALYGDLPSRVFYYGIPAVLAIIGIVALEQKPNGISRYALPTLLGDASYSIYLWHGLTFSVCKKVAAIGLISAQILFPFSIVVGTCFGIFAFKLVERPIMNLIIRSKSRKLT